MRSADDVTMPNDKVFPLMCWLQGHSPRWVSAMDHQYQMLEEWFRENETSCPHCESFACARENTQQHDSSVINTRKMQKINATLDKSKYCDIHKLIITMQKQCVTFFFGGGGGQCIWTEGAGVHSSSSPSWCCVPDKQAQFWVVQ